MALSNKVLQNILRMILKSEHYRKAVIDQIRDDFLHFAVQFFKDIVIAKYDGNRIDRDWYKKYFLDGSFPHDEAMIYAGLNKKTVENIYGGSAKSVLFEVVPRHYDELMEKVNSLVNEDCADLEIELTIRFNGASVHLSLSETLIVVNTLGVKRSQIRGGAWSGLGKKLELPLMLTLAKLYQVPSRCYAGKGLSGEGRDVDFHFISQSQNRYRCEVKLMGKGNPESADATIARDTDIFVADTLSELNKEQLPQRDCHWIELRANEGYKKTFGIFTELDIPCVEFDGNLDQALDSIIPNVFGEIEQAKRRNNGDP